MEKQKATSERAEACHFSGDVRQGKIWRDQGFNEPCFQMRRQMLRCHGSARSTVSTGGRRKRRCRKILRPPLKRDSLINRQLVEGLRQSTGPADGRANRSLRVGESKEKLFRVLR